LVASPKWDHAKAMFAAEVGRQDGPFDNPEGWDRYKLFNQSDASDDANLELHACESSYSAIGTARARSRRAPWSRASSRASASIDPTEGGNTVRHQVFVGYKLRPSESSEISALAYAGTYRFNLFSNFTLYLQDPSNGDEIEQIDRRTFTAASVSYRVVHTLGGVRFETTIGSNLRSDDIHEELWHSAERNQLGARA